jgi:hypothetical protein
MAASPTEALAGTAIRHGFAIFLAVVVWPATSSVNAQWVMAARAAKNRIQQLTQKSENGGYDLATVILEAPADKVYEKTLKSLQAHTDITITKNDEKTGRIEIKKGKQVASFQITPIEEKQTSSLSPRAWAGCRNRARVRWWWTRCCGCVRK